MRHDSKILREVQLLLGEGPKTVHELMGRSGYSRSAIVAALGLLSPLQQETVKAPTGGRRAIRYALLTKDTHP